MSNRWCLLRLLVILVEKLIDVDVDQLFGVAASFIQDSLLCRHNARVI